MIIRELLEKFNLNIDLPKPILELSFDEEYTEYEIEDRGIPVYIFNSPSSGQCIEIYLLDFDSYDELEEDERVVLWKGNARSGCGHEYDRDGIDFCITN